jgi:hypothetical protein
LTVTFDGDGGVTPSGTTTFSIGGATFSGGTVKTVGQPDLYGSGSFSYEVLGGTVVMIEFDQPITDLSLFFVSRSEGTTTLTAFNSDGDAVGTATAVESTAPAEDKFIDVVLSAAATQVEIEHAGGGDGWVDSFTFNPSNL